VKKVGGKSTRIGASDIPELWEGISVRVINDQIRGKIEI
jgi:hypothetical protein